MSNDIVINECLHSLPIEGEMSAGQRGSIGPSRFTYPFLYTPHPLAIKASEELKTYLRSKQEWQEEISRGKMFGVLVVKNHAPNTSPSGELHSLWAFSGLLDGKNTQKGFVPPVFDLQKHGEYFHPHGGCYYNLGHNSGNASTRSFALHSFWILSWSFYKSPDPRISVPDC